MNTLDIVRSLAATTSRTEKEEIISKAFLSGNREFFIGAKLANDKLISFGVKKVALIEEEDDGDPGTFSFDDFRDLCDKLSERKLTGHAARDAIFDAASQSNISRWNEFYRRILLKDMKIGCETSTINKVLGNLSKVAPEAKEYIIPVFACQLAKDGGDETVAKKIKGVKFLDLKLDGVRLLTVLDKRNRTVTQYSRNGHVIESFPTIREALEGMLDDLPGSVVLDGEVVSGSFQELMTQLQRKNPDDSSARLALFDVIPLDDFLEGYCPLTQRERHETLTLFETSGLLKKATNRLCYVLPKIEVDLDTPEGQQTFKEFNHNAIEAEFEGVMIKDPEAPYTGKRTFAWIKLKPFIEVTLKAVSLEEGKDDSKYKGTLGAIVFEGEDDGRHIVVNVGSGITDDERDMWWNDPNLIIGMMGEVRADAISKPMEGDVWSLRFPRLKGWRGRVPGEKL